MREIPSTNSVRRLIDVDSAKVWRTIGLPFFVDTVYMHACLLAHENKYLCRLLPVSAYIDGCLTSNYQSKWKK
jgi:hypothetical protein